MAFLGGTGDTATTVLELAGLDSYLGGQRRIASGWMDTERAMDGAQRSAMRMSNTGTVLAVAGGSLATAAVVMGKSWLTAAGDMQATRTGFATMLGSMDAAKAKIGELQKFAADTPFDFAQSAKGAQRLLATGIAADKLVPTMRAVAGAVAAAGGSTEEFLGVLTAVGQIKSKGKLDLEELNQIKERGIDLQFLQKELGLTAAQMQNLGNQKIDADTAIGALVSGFDKKFGNALNEAAGNYNNAESNFSDSLQQFKTVAGESLLPMATEALQGLTHLVEKGTEFIGLHPGFSRFVILFGLIGGAVVVVGGAILKLRANLMLASAAAKILAADLNNVGSANVGSGGVSAGVSGGRGRGNGGGSSGGPIIGSDASEANDSIAKIYNARKKAALDLSRAMKDLRDATAGSVEADKAQQRVDAARKVRSALDGAEQKARAKFENTDEGKAAGGGGTDVLGAAKDIAEAIANGEDATDALKSKLQEIGQEKLDDFLGDPKGTLEEWKDTFKGLKSGGLKAFGSLKGFMSGGLSIPTAGSGGIGGQIGSLAARVGLSGGPINTVSAFGQGGGAMTGGAAVAGLALGAGAAYGARDDLKALGQSEGAADLYAGILGAVTAGAVAFFPPAALIVGAAEAIRFGVDKWINQPMEQAANDGSIGPDGEKKLADAGKSKIEQSKIYFDLAEKARNEGDDVSAESFMRTAQNRRRDGLKDEQDAATAAQFAEMEADQKARTEQDMLDNPEKYTGVDPNASPYIRPATGAAGNGAFEANGGDPPPFGRGPGMNSGGGNYDFASNYGDQGLNPNDYAARARRAASGGDGAGYTVEDNRNGTRRVTLDIPRDPNADIADRLRRHNATKTRF